MSSTMHPTVGIIADDLTGALDGGLQLWKSGHRVSVYLPFWIPRGEANAMPEGLIVLDTESRNCGVSEAKERTGRAVSFLESKDVPLAYKKIDSTFRGHPGPELEEILTSTSFETVLVSPALPRLGRTVLEGVLLLDGVPLKDTEFGRDPLSPVTGSSVCDLLAARTSLSVRRLSVKQLDAAAADPDQFLATIDPLAPSQVVVADAETEEDLRTAARLIAACNGRVLPCGSAGFLEFLVLEAGGHRSGFPGGKPGQILVISSSMSGRTRAQIENFARESDTVIVTPDRSALFAAPDTTGIADEDAERIVIQLEDQRDVVLDSSGNHDDLPDDPDTLRIESRKLQDYLQQITARVFQAPVGGRLSGLVLAGGDTALSVCTALGARGIGVNGEVEPFVPAGSVIGGPAEGLEIVTKAGGFGSPSVFIKAREFLTSQNNGR